MTDQAPAKISEQAAPVAPEGARQRRAFMPKHFIPNADWINVNIVAKGKGTKATLGRVFGVCTGFEIKNNTLPDGSPSSSVALKGMFNTENYMDGELSECTVTYLPASYSEKVMAMFQADDSLKVVEVDVDVGLEATGKTIPYEWVIIAYREGEEMAVLKRLRNSRGRPKDVPALAAPAAQAAALSAPTGGDVIEGETVKPAADPAPKK